MTATTCTTFATTHRMVDRIHSNTANMRATTEVAGFAGFTKAKMLVLAVAD